MKHVITPRPGRRQHLHTVDLIRLAAAIMVVVFHYGTLTIRGQDLRFLNFVPLDRLPDALAPIVRPGWVGVQIFFVISGYVIAISALGSSSTEFARRRFLRLAPTAWICATITLLCLSSVAHWPAALLAAEWFIAATLWPIGESIDPSFWTIGIEISFYALVAATLGASGQQASLDRIALVVGTASSAFVVACALGMHVAWVRGAQLCLLYHGCYFALGISLQSLSSGTGSSLRRAAAATLLLPACIIGIMPEVVAVQATPDPSRPMALIIFALAVAALVYAPSVEHRIGASRVTGAIAAAGSATYPLYLVHQTVGTILIGDLLGLGLDGSVAIAVALALIVTLALLIARYGEPPLRHYVAKRLTTRPVMLVPPHDPAPDNRRTAFR